MFETITEIEEIPVELISPHPKNPRKDLGDIEELTDSIKKTGILQNLTVIRRGSRYQVLIGHRRFAAAKAAGLEKVPCKVVTGLSESEQVAIMLEENMQRNDLTVLEQAQGFQMMLDLGETIDDVAKKSGFSKRTVQHRVNIAKLDQKLVEEKASGMQLSLMDFIELERLKSIQDRNEILKKAAESYQIKGLVENKLNEIARNERIEKIKQDCIDKGLTEAPEGFKSNRYSAEWEYNYIPDASDNYKVPDGYEYYDVSDYGVYIVKKRVEQAERDLPPEEIEKEKERKRKQEIADQIKALRDDLKKSIFNHFKGSIGKEMRGITQEALWEIILDSNGFQPMSTMYRGAESIYGLEEERDIKDAVDHASMIEQMLFVVIDEAERLLDVAVRPAYSWEKGVIESNEEDLGKFYRIVDSVLEPNGWTWPSENVRKLYLREHEFFKEENDG